MIHTFHPTSIQISDFFMRVSSSIKNSPLYHDSNGFLVAKRYLNSRPDYNVKISPHDFINANTYPACSFAYLMEGDKKLVFFLIELKEFRLVRKVCWLISRGMLWMMVRESESLIWKWKETHGDINSEWYLQQMISKGNGKGNTIRLYLAIYPKIP